MNDDIERAAGAERAVVDGLRREFDTLWEETLSVLDGPDCPPLDWRPSALAAAPGPGDGAAVSINPAGVLARHIAGADLFWVGEMAGGRPSGRVRAREFDQPPPTPAELRAAIGRCREAMESVLGGLADSDLDEKVAPPAPKVSPTASSHPLLRTVEQPARLFCVLHALTHHAHHNGQLLLLKRLWQAGRSTG